MWVCSCVLDSWKRGERNRRREEGGERVVGEAKRVNDKLSNDKLSNDKLSNVISLCQGTATNQHFIIRWYIALGQPGGGGWQCLLLIRAIALGVGCGT